MRLVSVLGLLLLLVAYVTCASNENYGINLFKDYLRNGKEYETILNGEIPPKYLYFYRASPSLLLPGVGRRELEEDGPLELPEAVRDMAVVRPIAARTFVAKRDVGGEEQRSKEVPAKKALFSWPAEPRRPDDLRFTQHPAHAV